MTSLEATTARPRVALLLELAKVHFRERFFAIPASAAILVFSMIATGVVIALMTGLSFHPFPDLTGLALALLALDLYCRFATPSFVTRRVPVVFYAVAFVAVTCFSGIFASYATQRIAMPFCDGALLAMDQALGVDWVTLVRWVDARPTLSGLLAKAYSTMALQIVAAGLILGFFGSPEKLRVYVHAFALALTFVIAFCAFFPAMSPLHLIEGNETLLLSPFRGPSPVAQLDRLRADGALSLNLSSLMGLLCFPSFHVASTALATLCLRSIRGIFYVFLATNICLVFGTVTTGGHYVVDVFAGIALAFAAVHIAEKQEKKRALSAS